MFKLKLISANLNSNYVERADNLYLTVKFQNIGDTPLNKAAMLAADVVFLGRHRREQDQPDSFRFTWKPCPALNNWRGGEVWSTTGVWRIPECWGASFDVKLSVITADGEQLPFIGEGGREVYSQSISEIDLGWGWGRSRLLEQRSPIERTFNKISIVDVNPPQGTVDFCGFSLGNTYPQILGYNGEKWSDICPVLYERDILKNEIKAYPLSELNCALISKDENAVCYEVKSRFVSAEIYFKKADGKFLLGLQNASAAAGFELINIEFPVIAESSKSDAIMTNYFGGGRVLELKNALPQAVEFIFDVTNTYTVGNKELAFCANGLGADCIMLQGTLMGEDNVKCGFIGAKLVVSHPANKAGLKSIPVRPMDIELYVLHDASWKSSAFILRDGLPESKRRYEGVSIGKIMLDASAQYDPDSPATHPSLKTNHLNDVEKYCERIAGVTDNAPQVLYFVGWQKGGHDFEYPYTYKALFNDRVGSDEKYLQMAKRFKRDHNMLLSFHDNFDDAYLSENYEIGDDIIALDEEGKLHKGWLWAGGMSYIVAPKKYIQSGKCDERVAGTVERFNLGEIGTYHLDVMTSENRRYDFDPKCPSSAQENLEAKLKIIEKFNAMGVDITSETLGYNYLSHVGYGNGLRNKMSGEVLKGDKFVPLTTVAMHGVVPYLLNYNSDSEMLMGFIIGNGNALLASAGEGIECDDKTLAEKYYLFSLPMMKFVYKKISDMDYCDCKCATVYYGEDSYIKSDVRSNTYEIVFEGKKIAWDFNTFAERDGNYYLYSRLGGALDLELPAEFTDVKVYALSGSGRKEVAAVSTIDGKLTFEAAAGVAYVFEKA